MKKMSKILATVIAIIMIVTAIPMTALAGTGAVELGQVETVHVNEDETTEYLFVPEETSVYVVYSLADDDSYIDPYIEIYDAYDNFVASDDDNDYADTYNFYCVFFAEADEEYYFYLGEYDGCEVEYDFCVEEHLAIYHQPTADEPYVTLNKEDDDAEYQWYSVYTLYEITDEDATGRAGEEDNYAYYDSDCGWVGVFTGESYDYSDEYNFFTIELEAGQTIVLTADEYASELGIWNENPEFDCSEYWKNVEAGETVYFTATEDDTYNVYGIYDNLPYLVAEYAEVEAIEGETEDYLSHQGVGTYFCEVTFGDGRTEDSHMFDVDCNHSCHQGGIRGFFWMIINFFNSLFGLNPICECGEWHY